MESRLTGTGVAALRDHNQALVLRQIILSPGLSRTEIAGRIGLTDAAVSRITRELIDSGLVREGEEVPGGPRQRGRRHVQLEPDSDGAGFLAVSLTISDRRVSLVDLAGRRRAEILLPPALPHDYPALLNAISGAVKEVCARARVPRHRILGIAMTTAGAVAHGSGVVIASSLAVLRGRDVAADLAARLGAPAVVETVGNSFGVAEAHLAARQGASAMMGPSLVVHVAFGLGMGVMLDGVPLRTGGDERLASHLSVAGGRQRCLCSAQGCLMAEAAGYGILRRLEGLPADAAAQGWEDMRPAALREAVERANAGDAVVTRILEAAGHVLGQHLFALGAPIAPRRVLLGGPVVEAAPYVAGVRRGLLEAHARVGETPPVLRVSGIDYLQAAELLAIEEFALRRPLALERLMAA
jgi:predicted NBD/HSP70 family sugar kinase